MHIYAFGSVVRGDVSTGSDIDVLAVVEGEDSRFDPNTFSIYSYNRLKNLWLEGNPFAWHLSLESRLLYSQDESDFFAELGTPQKYKNCLKDCEKFFSLFTAAQSSVLHGSNSMVFDLSTIFLSIRNFASCFALGVTDQPNFSRNAALGLGGNSINVSLNCYTLLERARILSTRGHGDNLKLAEIQLVISELDIIRKWMTKLIRKAKEL